MAKILVWAFLIYITYRVVVKLIRGAPQKPELKPESEKGALAYQDPVCGIYVTEEDAVIGRLDGQRYYFCSKKCLEKFQEKLDKGLGKC